MDSVSQTTLDERQLYQQVWFLDQQLNCLPFLKNLSSERICSCQYEHMILNIYHLSKFWSSHYQAVEKSLEIPSFALIKWHLNALQEEIEHFESFYLTFQQPAVQANALSVEDYLGCSYVIHFWQSNAKNVLSALEHAPLLANHTFSFEYLRAIDSTKASVQWQDWRAIFSDWSYKQRLCQVKLTQSATDQFNRLVEFFAKNQLPSSSRRCIS